MKHLHLQIRFFVSSIPVLVFGKKNISFLVMFICKNDMKFEEKLNVISTELGKPRVSKLQTEILLLISALFFNFANISNDIRYVNSNEFVHSTETLRVKNFKYCIHI